MSTKVATQLEPWCDLRNKVVLVTGASSGLGKDFCLDLAKAGCRILAAARRVDRLKSLCDEINQMSLSFPTSSSTTEVDIQPRAVAVELDVSADGNTIDKCVQKAWDAFGGIDALVNNAGVRGTVRDPLELSEEEWNHVIRTNTTGTWLVSKAVCIRMRDSKRGGSVINIASIAGLNRGQLPGGLHYVASKTGVNAISKMGIISVVDSSVSGLGVARMLKMLLGMLLLKILLLIGLGVKTNIVDLQKIMLAGNFICKHLGHPSALKTAKSSSKITDHAP